MPIGKRKYDSNFNCISPMFNVAFGRCEMTEKQKNSIIGELRGTSMKEQKRDIKKIMKKLDLAITSHNEKKQELLSKELNEKMKEFFTFLSKNAKVKIEVKGGVAEVTQCPDWIKTEVLDHDNY